jgi:serine/threonine-protein kinase
MGWRALRPAGVVTLAAGLICCGWLAGCAAQFTEERMAAPADGMAAVAVPAGAFAMGSAWLDPLRFGWEKPRHMVTLDAFWIDQTEVTNAQFARFVAASGYVTDAERAGGALVFDPSRERFDRRPGADWRHPQGPASSIAGFDAHPAVAVSWNDATAYCRWAGRRLPTEAEWEKAARGTDRRRYPWGNRDPAGELLNFAERSLSVSWGHLMTDDGYARTAPVGNYPAGVSPYGALDMAGNVWEWTADWFDPDYYGRTPAANPTGPAEGTQRVVRGGGWSGRPRGLRAAHRDKMAPADASDLVGLRCAATR